MLMRACTYVGTQMYISQNLVYHLFLFHLFFKILFPLPLLLLFPILQCSLILLYVLALLFCILLFFDPPYLLLIPYPSSLSQFPCLSRFSFHFCFFSLSFSFLFSYSTHGFYIFLLYQLVAHRP